MIDPKLLDGLTGFVIYAGALAVIVAVVTFCAGIFARYLKFERDRDDPVRKGQHPERPKPFMDKTRLKSSTPDYFKS